MNNLFENYRIALMDASFYKKDFSDKLRMGLKSKHLTVYIPETFTAEYAQYKAIISEKRQELYARNMHFLNAEVRLAVCDFSSFGNLTNGLHNDIWGLVKLLSGMGAKMVMITGDKLLIERIIVENIKIDIYDLNGDGFIRHNRFPSFLPRFELRISEKPKVYRNDGYHAGEGAVLYCANGNRVVLGKKINSGMEADIYRVKGEPGKIVKVFTGNNLNEEKYKNILDTQNMNERLAIQWALFPLDAVYYDADCKAPAGFTESFAKVGQNLNEHPLYMGSEANAGDSLDLHLSYSLELCMQVVRQVRYLNGCGFLVSDFNRKNFSFIDDSPFMQMWDTDSFSTESYFSRMIDGSALSREYDITKKKDVIGLCSEALYVFVFYILSMGDTPISEFSGKFKFDNPDYIALYRRELFPENLWELFEEVFRGKKEASSEALLQQLHIALEKCRRDPKADPTYRQVLSEYVEGLEPEPIPARGNGSSTSNSTVGQGNGSSTSNSTVGRGNSSSTSNFTVGRGNGSSTSNSTVGQGNSSSTSNSTVGQGNGGNNNITTVGTGNNLASPPEEEGLPGWLRALIWLGLIAISYFIGFA